MRKKNPILFCYMDCVHERARLLILSKNPTLPKHDKWIHARIMRGSCANQCLRTLNTTQKMPGAQGSERKFTAPCAGFRPLWRTWRGGTIFCETSSGEFFIFMRGLRATPMELLSLAHDNIYIYIYIYTYLCGQNLISLPSGISPSSTLIVKEQIISDSKDLLPYLHTSW